MEEEKMTDLKYHLKTYPEQTDKFERQDLIKTKEYRKILANKKRLMRKDWRNIGPAIKVLNRKLGDMRYNLKRGLKHTKENEIRELKRQSCIEAETLLNKKKLEILLDVLNSSKLTPINLTRSIKYFRRKESRAYGDCDSGYEKWEEIVLYAYFENRLDFMKDNKIFEIGINGDIYIENTEPRLRVDSIRLGRSKESRLSQYLEKISERYKLRMRSTVGVNEFYYRDESCKGLENLRIDNEDTRYLSIDPRELTNPVKEVIKYINSHIGKVKSNLTDFSRVKYNGNNGEACLIQES